MYWSAHDRPSKDRPRSQRKSVQGQTGEERRACVGAGQFLAASVERRFARRIQASADVDGGGIEGQPQDADGYLRDGYDMVVFRGGREINQMGLDGKG